MAEKKKRKRKWWLWIPLGLLLVAIGSLSFMATREDPRYVDAAKGLEAARAEGHEVIGHLTLDEYRAERGYEYVDHRQDWRDLSDSMPDSIRFFSIEDSLPTTDFAAMCDLERAWFEGFLEKLPELTLHIDEYQIVTRELRHRAFYFHGVLNALSVGLLAAADQDDREGIKLYAETMTGFAARLALEPSSDQTGWAMSFRNRLIRSLVLAAVRNRHDPALVECLGEQIDQFTTLPDLPEISAGDFRTYRESMFGSFDIRPDLIQRYLWETRLEESGFILFGKTRRNADLSWFVAANEGEEIERRSFKIQMERVGAQIEARRKGTDPNSIPDLRRTGRHTSAAFETRALETWIKHIGFLEEIKAPDSPAVQHLDTFVRMLEVETDPSYEMVKRWPFGSDYVGWWFADSLFPVIAKTSIALIQRYPEIGSLPDALPADLEDPDPFRPGSNLVYRKTARGFHLYSVGMDGGDGGLEDYGTFDGKQVAFNEPSGPNPDLGMSIDYDPFGESAAH